MLSLLRSLFTSECIVELRSDRLRVRDLVATLHDLSQRAGALRTIVHRGAGLSSHEAWSRLQGKDSTH